MTRARGAAFLLAALFVAPPLARAGETDAPPLPDAAQRLADEGRPLDAWHALVDGLLASVRGLPQASPRAVAEAEIACLQLTDLTRSLQAFPEAVAALPALRAAAGPQAPPHIDFLLAALDAEVLRDVGRCDDSRAISDTLGWINDVLVLGPFDNERGGGLEVAQPPESAIDLAAAVRGKERDVSWRPNPCPRHPLKRLLLGEMLRPNKQALAYVATAIPLDAPRTVVLRLGSSGAFKLFLNGVTIATRNVERPQAADQDRYVLPLGAGCNQLLVKSCNEDQEWTLELRVTDLAGRPLELPVSAAHVATPDAALHDATVAALADPALAHPAPEARDVLQAAGDPGAARLLALYHLLVHPDDRTARTARVAAQRALDATPDSADAFYLLARADAPEGEDRTEMQVNPRLAALEAVLAREPGHVGALLDLAGFVLDDSPQPDRADDLTRRALAAAPQSWRAASLRAELLRQRRRGSEAEALLDAAADGPEAQLSVSGALQRADRATRRGDRPAALAALRAAADRDGSDGKLTEVLLGALADEGQPAAVGDAARRSLAGAPFSTDRALAAAEHLEFAGDVDGARSLVESALAVCPDSADALRDRARLAERRADVAAAEADLRRVLELDPGDDKVRRHLQILQTGAEKERFEQPYRSDAAALLGAPLAGGDREPLECLDRTTVWRVFPDGTESVYEHQVLRVLNEGGVKELSSVPIPSLGGSIQVYNVRVLHADGTVERAPPARGGWRDYDLPSLRVGDLVDVEYRADEDAPDVFGRYFGMRHEFYPDLLDGLMPVRHARLVVLAPPELPVWFTERHGDLLALSDATDAHGVRELTWIAHDLPRPPQESAMPRREELAPVVDVSTFRDWDAFAHWWWSFIQKDFVSSPAMQAKVAELTAGKTTELEKVAAIERFVAQEVRYNSWPFGTHGYQPFSAATIFERRFGDCKDKAILLRQMLAEIGVDAVPVLIKAEYERADEPAATALVELFNHCIDWVTPTADRPGYYLDATADRNPIDYLRTDDQGARVLHVTGSGGELHDIPYAPPSANGLHRRWEVDLRRDGAGTIALHDDSNGDFGVRLRYRYGGQQGDLQHDLADDLSRTFGAVHVLEARTSELDDVSQPAQLDARFDAPSLWTPEGDARALRVGFDDLGLDGVATEPSDQRHFDVVLDRPFAQDTTVVWRLPPGARLLELPPDVDISAPGLLSYTQHARQVEGRLEVQRHFELLVRRVAPAAYAGFREALQQVQKADERRLRIALPPAGEGQ